MGQTMIPLTPFTVCVSGNLVPAKRCAVISAMSRRRAFKTARLQKIAINQKKIAHIVTGHQFCKTPPAEKMLLGSVLVVNRIYKPHAFFNIRVAVLSSRNCYQNWCKM